jgi:hypothetical protein
MGPSAGTRRTDLIQIARERRRTADTRSRRSPGQSHDAQAEVTVADDDESSEPRRMARPPEGDSHRTARQNVAPELRLAAGTRRARTASTYRPASTVACSSAAPVSRRSVPMMTAVGPTTQAPREQAVRVLGRAWSARGSIAGVVAPARAFGAPRRAATTTSARPLRTSDVHGPGEHRPAPGSHRSRCSDTTARLPAGRVLDSRHKGAGLGGLAKSRPLTETGRVRQLHRYSPAIRAGGLFGSREQRY